MRVQPEWVVLWILCLGIVFRFISHYLAMNVWYYYCCVIKFSPLAYLYTLEKSKCQKFFWKTFNHIASRYWVQFCSKLTTISSGITLIMSPDKRLLYIGTLLWWSTDMVNLQVACYTDFEFHHSWTPWNLANGRVLNKDHCFAHKSMKVHDVSCIHLQLRSIKLTPLCPGIHALCSEQLWGILMKRHRKSM